MIQITYMFIHLYFELEIPFHIHMKSFDSKVSV